MPRVDYNYYSDIFDTLSLDKIEFKWNYETCISMFNLDLESLRVFTINQIQNIRVYLITINKKFPSSFEF